MDASRALPHTDPMHVITDERCLNYSQEFHPERPQRVAGTLKLLREQTELKIAWEKPAKVTDALITSAHEKGRVRLVAQHQWLLSRSGVCRCKRQPPWSCLLYP